MKTISNYFLIGTIALSIVACGKSTKKTVLKVNGTSCEFQFQKTKRSEIIAKLGKGKEESEFNRVIGNNENKGVVDERIYYKDLGLTFYFLSHEPTNQENASTQIATLWRIVLDSSGTVIDGLEVGMSKNQIESNLGPAKIPDGATDSTAFFYKYINWLFTARKNSRGQYILTQIERNYPVSLGQ